MKIIRQNSRKTSHFEPNPLSLEQGTTIDLRKIYSSPSIGLISFHKDCHTSIQQFVQQSVDKNPVPEVGGFLLGNYFREADGTIHTFAEVFVPSYHVAFNSPILLDFGTQSMIEWNEAQEKYPELISIGWFHTHPGHTPYLSNTDLNMHQGFFPLDHQIALVIDPLTEEWDTGIFCRDTDHKMYRILKSHHYLPWRDLSRVSS